MAHETPTSDNDQQDSSIHPAILFPEFFTKIELLQALTLEEQAGNMASNSSLFPSFLDNSTGPSNNLGGAPRLAPSPMAQQQQQQQTNGNGNGMNGMPIIAGQQMDVNLLYQKVLELSDVLKENREKAQGIVNGAEDLAVSDSIGVADIYCMLQQERIRLFGCTILMLLVF